MHEVARNSSVLKLLNTFIYVFLKNTKTFQACFMGKNNCPFSSTVILRFFDDSLFLTCPSYIPMLDLKLLNLVFIGGKQEWGYTFEIILEERDADIVLESHEN